MPYCKGLRHNLYLLRGHRRSDTLKLGWVEEIPRWQESSCWTGHPNYYQEHQPPRLKDDDCLRYHLELHMCVRLYHLELHMCVWLYHLELHMMIVVDII